MASGEPAAVAHQRAAGQFADLTPGLREAAGGEAYRFFRSHVELPGPLHEPLDLHALTAVVVERLAVVDITTGSGDNAHRIFPSLNATGVNLTQADLLRNLIFMLLPSRASAVYDEVWQPMERLIGFLHVPSIKPNGRTVAFVLT